MITQCYCSYLDDFEVSNCAKYKNELSNITSVTSNCFVRSSQPLRICTNCQSQFKILTDKYGALFTKRIYQGKVSCYDILLQSDISTSLEDIQKVFTTVWDECNCDQCYVNGNFSEDYIKFIQLEKSVMGCLQNYTNASLHFTHPDFETIWDGYYFDKGACKECSYQFNEVKKYYNKMQHRKKEKSKLWDGVCGDLGDMLNTTRYLWSKYYQCDIYTADIVLISPIFVIIGITLLFYCLVSTYFHNKMKTVLYKQRRLRHLSKDFGPSNLLETIK